MVLHRNTEKGGGGGGEVKRASAGVATGRSMYPEVDHLKGETLYPQ